MHATLSDTPTPCRPRTSRASGFTLIELLVVIAIIALLMAILFPVFGRVREGARTKSCASNMKQLGMAFQQYVQDNARRYPGAGNFQVWGAGGHWIGGTNGTAVADISTFEYTPGTSGSPENGALYPLVRNAAVYVCPSNGDGKQKKFSYAMNCALSGINDVRIRQPSDIVLLVDEDKANDGFFYATNNSTATVAEEGKPAEASGAGGNSTDALAKYHNGGGNLLFVDGHVKFYPFDSFILDASDPGKANKYRRYGSPRFHDRAFGPKGSTYPPSFAVAAPGPPPASGIDSCSGTIS